MTAPLDNLHDFYQPPQPAWIPQTAGWYVVFAIVGLLIVWAILHAIRGWHANRYRRESLRELANIAPDQFSALLKRAALSAWPRSKVASLSGGAWLDFLNQTASMSSFHSAPGKSIEEISLRATVMSMEDEQALRQVVAEWIRRHRV